MATGAAVVGGGAVAVDHLLFVDGSIGDGKGRVVRQETRYGGNVATAMVAAARTGSTCAFIGHLPDETSDQGILDFLRAEGIDISDARIAATTAPIRSVIIVGNDGQRFIAYDDNTAMGVPADADLDTVRAARVLILDEYGIDGGVRAAQAARSAGVAVVADIERATDGRVTTLMNLTDHLILPIRTALRLTGTNVPEAAVAALWRSDRAAVVVTDGANGCWYRMADQAGVRHQPAQSVTVVDTTGCGDVFHGSYAAALAQGNPVEACVARATAAAADCATHPGGIRPRPADTTGPAEDAARPAFS